MLKKFKVSNMKSERGMVELRIIAGEPPIAGASVVEPTLEDVYLRLTQSERKECV